jgi:hypothetical protein
MILNYEVNFFEGFGGRSPGLEPSMIPTDYPQLDEARG